MFTSISYRFPIKFAIAMASRFILRTATAPQKTTTTPAFCGFLKDIRLSRSSDTYKTSFMFKAVFLLLLTVMVPAAFGTRKHHPLLSES